MSNLGDHFSLFDLPDRDRSWVGRAACRGDTHSNFFPRQMGEIGVREAQRICDTCPVKLRCLEYAINNNIGHGIWGGLTTRARRELASARRNRSDIDLKRENTVAVYNKAIRDGETNPVRTTANALGISPHTVYHHIRIDKLMREIENE